MKGPENQPAAPEIKVKVFTSATRPPSKSLLDRYARLYMAGFNQPPWDIYEYNYTPEKAREEFALLVSAALSSGGALISLRYGGKPAGFSVLNSLALLVREIPKAAENRRKPPHYRSPARYFARLSQLLNVSCDEFDSIGYIADVVVDDRYRGKGLAKILISSSLEYLKNTGKKYALAWTVNPAMDKIFTREGFELLKGIGEKGEGIDFTVHNGVWYPTMALPAKGKTTQPAAARHYVKRL